MLKYSKAGMWCLLGTAFVIQATTAEIVYENGSEEMSLGAQTDRDVKTYWHTRYAKGPDDGRLSVVDEADNVRSGKGLKVRYPKERRGTGDSGVTWESDIQTHAEELYLGYWVKFDENFEWRHGGKLPGLGGTFSPFPGEDKFRIRLMWREDGKVEFYLHDFALLNKEGEVPYRHWWDLGGQRAFQKGKWHHIEIHVKLNTPGQLDGVLEGWFDGELAFRDTDSNVGVRGIGQDDRQINYLCWHTFFGGGSDPDDDGPLTANGYWGPTKDVYAYFDDFKVSTTRIGTGDGAPSQSLDLDSLIAATDFDAESHPNDENKIRKSTSNIGYIQNGTWVRYDDMQFGAGADSIEVQAATPNAGGDIEVRINSSTGTRLGTVNVTNTGAWNTYRTFRADLSPTTGTKDLYLVFKGGSGGLMNVKSFRLNSAAAAPSGYTECAREGGTVTFDTIVDVAYGANGNYVYLDNVTGPVYFHNSIFGDPIPGVAKKGYDRPAQGGTTGKAYSWNNGEEATDFKQVGHSVNNGILSMTLETADNDPYVRMKNADINGNTYTHIRLKVRNNTSGTAWKMYFNPAGGGEGGNSIEFTVPADQAWHTYVLKMDTDPDWKGTISSIRLDPQGSVSGSVDVDYVNIISAP